MKYLSINEPHLPTDLLNKGSAASSRGNRGPVGCVHIRSWAPGWPSVAPQQVSEPFFVSTVQISDFLPASRRATFWMNSSPTPLQIPPLRGRGGRVSGSLHPLAHLCRPGSSSERRRGGWGPTDSFRDLPSPAAARPGRVSLLPVSSWHQQAQATNPCPPLPQRKPPSRRPAS